MKQRLQFVDEARRNVVAAHPAVPEGKLGVSALLRASRLRCGEEIEDVSRSLRIGSRYLRAIEEGRFQDLPGHTYAVGFVRAYAQHLGLDSPEVVRRFKAESVGAAEKTPLDFPTPISEAGVPRGALVFVGLVVAVLAYGGWYVSTLKEGFFADVIAPLPERLMAVLTGERRTEPEEATEETAAAEPASPSAATAAVRSGGSPARQPAESAARPLAAADLAASETAPRPEPAEAAGAVAVAPATPSGTAEPAVAPASPRAGERPAGPAVGGPEAAGAASEPAAGARPLAKPSPRPLVDVSIGDGPTASDVAAVPTPRTAPPREEAATPALERTPPARAPSPVPESEAVQAPAAETSGGTRPAPAGGLAHADTRVGASPSPPASTTAIAAAPPEALARTDAGKPAEPATPAAVSPGRGTDAPAPEASPRADVATVPAGRVYGAPEAASRIVITARANSWIQVRDDAANEMLLTRLLRVGDTYRVPNRLGLKLLTGDAGALDILVDGKPVPPLGSPGKVRRNVLLDPDRLLAGTAVAD